MEEVQIIKSFISLKSKRDVLKLHFFSKLLERGIFAYPTELEMLIELYFRKGYHSKDEMDDLFEFCLENKLRASKQSFNNAITKFVNAGVIKKLGVCKREINPDFIPYIPSDFIGLTYNVINDK
jgi:hypothetical protein